MNARRRVVATVCAVVAAAAIVIGWRVVRPQAIVLAQADRRPLEARLSEPTADRWRPYDRGFAREEVRVDALHALERRGDWRALGDAYLLAGEIDRATVTLARARESADVESDRAAAALQAHDAATALADATRALSLAPGHRQAAWNRALALRDLGLWRTATAAFDAIAHHGERGWGDEARTRRDALRATLPTRDDATRRALLARANEARAQGKVALADAFVDEARALLD